MTGSPHRWTHFIWLLAGLLCLIAGLATILLPLPLGVPFLAAGSVILIRQSRKFRHILQHARAELGWLDAAMLWLQRRAPSGLTRILRETDPRP